MDKEPQFEKQETPEKKLIRLLKEKGVEDPETREILNSWIYSREKEIEKLEGEPYRLAQISFNIQRACIYFQGGYAEEALTDLEETRVQIFHELGEESELYDEVIEQMDEIEDFLRANIKALE